MSTTKNNGVEEQIIEAARRLFTEHGFAATCMSDIAASAGINRPALHYYFRTKERLFRAVFRSLILSMRPKVEDIIRKDLSFMECIGLILEEYEQLFLANPSLPRFISGEIHRDVQQLMKVAKEEQMDKTILALRQRLEDEMEAGQLRRVPVHVVFMSFYSLLTFPFFSQKLLVQLFLKDENGFPTLLQEWKQYTLFYLNSLLLPGKEETPQTGLPPFRDFTTRFND